MLLNCPHEHLVSLRTQHRQLVLPPQYEDSPTRLTFLNQPDIYGVAYFVAARGNAMQERKGMQALAPATQAQQERGILGRSIEEASRILC